MFGQRVLPHENATLLLKAVAIQVCKQKRVMVHQGRTFSVDTLLAQYPYIDAIQAMGCNTIEMESAAAFRAAKVIKRPIAALFSVSDNIILEILW